MSRQPSCEGEINFLFQNLLGVSLEDIAYALDREQTVALWAKNPPNVEYGLPQDVVAITVTGELVLRW